MANPTFTGNVTAPTFIGALTGNASSATKLQTAITIAGVSFDGTANIDIPFANLVSKPTTLAGYGITDGASLSAFNSHVANKANPHAVTTAQIGALPLTGGTLSGNLTFSNSVSNIRLSTGSDGNAYIGSSGLAAPPSGEQDYGVYISSNAYRDADGKWYHGRTSVVDAFRFKAGRHNHFLWSYSPNVGAGEIDFIDLMSLRSNGNLGIGTTNPLYKLDVTGTGRFTSSLITPKVDFGNGFTIEPSGTELVFKYNGVIKQRMLSDGTILATAGITALTT